MSDEPLDDTVIRIWLNGMAKETFARVAVPVRIPRDRCINLSPFHELTRSRMVEDGEVARALLRKLDRMDLLERALDEVLLRLQRVAE